MDVHGEQGRPPHWLYTGYTGGGNDGLGFGTVRNQTKLLLVLCNALLGGTHSMLDAEVDQEQAEWDRLGEPS